MLELYQQKFKHQLIDLKFEPWRTYLRVKRQITFESVKNFHIGAASNIVPLELYNFQNTVVISNINQHGDLVGLFGRKLEDVEPKYAINQGYKKYSTIFGLWQAKESIIQEGYAILTEGIFDVISMHQLGFTNTIASPGKDWFPQQLALLRRYTDTVILLFDNDATGRRTLDKCVNNFFKSGFYVSSITLTNVKDIDELIRTNKEHARIFLKKELSRKNNKEE